jgi:hypothetical protein
MYSAIGFGTPDAMNCLIALFGVIGRNLTSLPIAFIRISTPFF